MASGRVDAGEGIYGADRIRTRLVEYKTGASSAQLVLGEDWVNCGPWKPRLLLLLARCVQSNDSIMHAVG